MSSAATAPPVTLDPQDPLPESNWVPRRWYVFPTTGALLVLMFLQIEAKGDLLWLAVCLIVVVFCYLIAPSAEQAAKVIAAASALKAGVTFRSSATASTPDGQATATNEAGKAKTAEPAAAPPPAATPSPTDEKVADE